MMTILVESTVFFLLVVVCHDDASYSVMFYRYTGDVTLSDNR